MTMMNVFTKIDDAERRGILETRRAALASLRRMMLRRSWLGRLGLRIGFATT
jgi:hypothetical protein